MESPLDKVAGRDTLKQNAPSTFATPSRRIVTNAATYNYKSKIFALVSRDKFAEILGEYWGYEDFRGIQREIIQSISAGHDTLGLMPTGGGKSITFQVPALAADGVCLVITPLIALMKDQVNHLL